jgi:hypothetical protein
MLVNEFFKMGVWAVTPAGKVIPALNDWVIKRGPIQGKSRTTPKLRHHSSRARLAACIR